MAQTKLLDYKPVLFWKTDSIAEKNHEHYYNEDGSDSKPFIEKYEKFVLDCELLGMYHTYLKGVDWSEDAWAMEAIMHEVPPGGHHLGSSHTMRHFRHAFYRAELFDYEAAEAWQLNGAQDAYGRASTKVKQILRDYTQPPLDPATDEALRDFMARRKGEIEPEY